MSTGSSQRTQEAVTPVDGVAELRLHMILTYAGKVIVLVLSFGTTIALARGLGAEGRGMLAVAFAFAQLLAQFGQLGLPTSNPYWISRDPASAPRVIANALWCAALFGGALIVIGFVVRAVAPGTVEGVGIGEFVLALVGIPGMLASMFLQSILLGQKRMAAYAGIEVAQAAITILLLAIGFLVLDISAFGALAIMVGAVYFGVLGYLWRMRHDGPVPRGPQFGLLREMFGYAARLYGATLLSFLVIRVDLLMVNAYLSPFDAGQYSVAVALVDGVVLLPTVVGLNLFTRVAGGSDTELSAAVFRVVGVYFAIALAISVPLAPTLIETVFGAQYGTSAYYWWYLVPGVYSLGMLTILSHHFAGRGFPLEAMLVWFVALAVVIVINALFLKEHGAVVASISSSIAYGLLLILHMAMFSREAGDWKILIPRPMEALMELRRIRDRPS